MVSDREMASRETRRAFWTVSRFPVLRVRFGIPLAWHEMRRRVKGREFQIDPLPRFSFGEPSPPRGLHVPFRHYTPSAAAKGTEERPRVRGKGRPSTVVLGQSPEDYVFW